MSTAKATFPIRRVVVALEAVCDHAKALEIAANIAARTNAEMHGIFIEDVDLLSAARLPFVRQINLHSAIPASFQPPDIELEFRTSAARAKVRLESLAHDRNLLWSFEVHRGNRSTLVPVTRTSDLLVVETATRPFARDMALPIDWSEISMRSERTCLLLGRSGRPYERILAVYDGTASGERAVAAALALDGKATRLTVIAAVPLPTDLQRQVRVAGADIDLRRTEQAEPGDWPALVAHARCDLAILPSSLVIAGKSALRTLLLAPPCAILLVPQSEG